MNPYVFSESFAAQSQLARIDSSLPPRKTSTKRYKNFQIASENLKMLSGAHMQKLPLTNIPSFPRISCASRPPYSVRALSLTPMATLPPTARNRTLSIHLALSPLAILAAQATLVRQQVHGYVNSAPLSHFLNFFAYSPLIDSTICRSASLSDASIRLID